MNVTRKSRGLGVDKLQKKSYHKPKGFYHKPFLMLEGCAKINGYTLNDLAASMKITRRTLNKKIDGSADFTPSEMIYLKTMLKRSVDVIFLTK